MTKAEFADLCKVSTKKVQRWCNVDYIKELTALGYNKYQKIFTPCQTQFLKQNILEYTEK